MRFKSYLLDERNKMKKFKLSKDQIVNCKREALGKFIVEGVSKSDYDYFQKEGFKTGFQICEDYENETEYKLQQLIKQEYEDLSSFLSANLEIKVSKETFFTTRVVAETIISIEIVKTLQHLYLSQSYVPMTYPLQASHTDCEVLSIELILEEHEDISEFKITIIDLIELDYNENTKKLTIEVNKLFEAIIDAKHQGFDELIIYSKT